MYTAHTYVVGKGRHQLSNSMKSEEEMRPGPALCQLHTNLLPLLFLAGKCSLKEFHEARILDKKILWQDDDKQKELVYLFHRIYEILKELFKFDIYHSDIKEQNIILYKEQTNNVFRNYECKLIDFGATVDSYEKFIACTRPYFPAYIYERVGGAGPVFESRAERQQAEMY